MKLNAKVVIPILIVALFVAVGVGVGTYLATRDATKYNGIIPYADNAVVLDKGGEIEPAEQGWINLKYNYQAFSKDGVHFSCFLANDAGNEYDLFFDLFADVEATDRLFLSGLLPPGTALNTVELNRALPVGSTTVYVAFNQVGTDEDGEQALVGQSVVTVEFIVLEDE